MVNENTTTPLAGGDHNTNDESGSDGIGGNRQSPINIVTKNCEIKTSTRNMTPLLINYPRLFTGLAIQNPGNMWRVDVPRTLSKLATVSGGPLEKSSYRLAQFHCHWAKDRKHGSEHTVDGKCYAAEMHFVHWNSVRYRTLTAAQTSDNGLATFAVFLDAGKHTNKELDKLLARFGDIQFEGSKADIAEHIDIEKLLPDNRSYFTYSGSLTTEPYNESVIWIVFANPVMCSVAQVDTFRELCCSDASSPSNRLVDCHRSQQPLNGRAITRVNQ